MRTNVLSTQSRNARNSLRSAIIHSRNLPTPPVNFHGGVGRPLVRSSTRLSGISVIQRGLSCQDPYIGFGNMK